MMCFVSRWWRVATDLVVLVVFGCLALSLELAGMRGIVVRRGFFCDDQSIRYPYQQHPAVPSWALIVGVLSIPFVTILLGNCYEKFYVRREDCLSLSLHHRLTICIPPWLIRTFFQLRWFLNGAILTVVITNIAKLVVGRLRPHFIPACDPDFSQFNCTDQFGYPVYVTDYTCRGPRDIENESRLSFPSGHSSLSTYAFVFLALYLASVRALYHRSAVKLFLMTTSFFLALLTSLSRISDHRHHPTDVVTGMLIGAVVAGIVVYYHLFYFSHHKPSSENVAMDTASNSSLVNPILPKNVKPSSVVGGGE